MSHYFKCSKCLFSFEVKDRDTAYNDDPQTRDCPECKDAKGEILYLGCSNSAPHIITDYIAGPGGALKNHADGKMYDSKSQYYKAVKEAGCEVLGNDAPREFKQREYKIDDMELKQDINNAIQQCGG